LGFVGQVVGVDADAVAANQTGAEREEVPFAAGGGKYGVGVEAEPVLGSRSRDTLSGLGPEPLAQGDTFAFGDPQGPRPAIGVAPVASPATVTTLRVTAGPRADWFAPEALELLAGAEWEVANESNRSGARLNGPPLPRLREGELLSEGLVEGAIQVRHSGLPMIMLADHPTTGGYPVIAVVAGEDISAAAKAEPQDSSSRTTCPCTSVSRRSMPLLRNVRRVWSMPSRWSIVACTS